MILACSARWTSSDAFSRAVTGMRSEGWGCGERCARGTGRGRRSGTRTTPGYVGLPPQMQHVVGKALDPEINKPVFVQMNRRWDCSAGPGWPQT